MLIAGGCGLDDEGEPVQANDSDSGALVCPARASCCPDLTRDAHLAFWVAAGDNCRGLPDQVLGAHLVGLVSNFAIPEEQLTEKEDEGACSTHQVPGRGKQEQQHDPDDEEHSENLREESTCRAPSYRWPAPQRAALDSTRMMVKGARRRACRSGCHRGEHKGGSR
jgi:hypothetical protein